MFRRTLLAQATMMALASTLLTTPSQAHEAKKGDLTIGHPAARPNLPNRPTAAYFTVTNAGATADRLVAARSESFGKVELHTVTKNGGVMTMMPVEGYDIPAGGTLALEPGGNHLMLFDATRRFKIGDSFMATLTFEKAGDVMIEVKVEKVAANGHGTMNHGSGTHDSMNQENMNHDSGGGTHSGHGTKATE